MRSERDILALHPEPYFRVKSFLEEAAAQGLDLLVTCVYRDAEAQDELYAQGRTKPGRIVTNAKGGESYHNWRCAVDVAPLVHGKILWDTTSDAGAAIWNKIGELGEAHGLEWAGRWMGKLREMAHFQYTGGLSLSELKSGMLPK